MQTGPAVALLTKYGLFNLRWYEEFGGHASPSGQELIFSLHLLAIRLVCTDCSNEPEEAIDY
jgi:hypothetical protein